MRQFNNKLNRACLCFLSIGMALCVLNVAYADESGEPLAFRKVFAGSSDGRYTIVPARNDISLEKLTGLKQLSREEYDRLSRLPSVQFFSTFTPQAVVSRVNNALHKYFRPIFSQSGGSCGQASGIGYAFTYELDFQRDLSADLEANQYPTHYTWNYLNGGVGAGSWYFDGWDIIRDNGCANVPTWGGMAGDDTRWMSGFANYYSGMHNRVAFYSQIADVNTPAGLDNLKQWLIDHGNGSAVGGLACFAVYIGGADYIDLPAGTPEAGKSMLIKWGNDGYHAMTVVGFDDEVRFDFNGDGLYTNDIDLDGDGMITMSDWEIGALLFANSWGTGYCNDGFCYMAYKSIADPAKNGLEALTWNSVHVVRTTPVNVPKVVMKTQISYLSRNKLDIYASATQAGVTYTKKFAKSLMYQGGDHPLRGREDYQPIELGLDVSSLYEQIKPQDCAQFNLHIQESDPAGTSTGTIHAFSLLDYTSGDPVEIQSTQTNVPIANNTLTTLSVNRCSLYRMRLQYYSYNTSPLSNTLFINIRLYNEGAAVINLADLSTRYWYTLEGAPPYETARVDWAGRLPSGQAVTAATLAEISPISQGGQNRVCTISFTADAGSIRPGEYVECQYRIYKSNWTNYNQLNDYSFGTQNYYRDWAKITVYHLGAPAWGSEP